jgi:hypothetical protein
MRFISTTELIKQREFGRISSYNLDLLNRRLDLEVELAKFNKYQGFIKKDCVAYNCNRELPFTWDHYKLYGNYCKFCCARYSSKAVMSKENRNLIMELLTGQQWK